MLVTDATSKKICIVHADLVPPAFLPLERVRIPTLAGDMLALLEGKEVRHLLLQSRLRCTVVIQS